MVGAAAGEPGRGASPHFTGLPTRLVQPCLPSPQLSLVKLNLKSPNMETLQEGQHQTRKSAERPSGLNSKIVALSIH